MATIIDGNKIAKTIKKEISEEISLFKRQTGITPCLSAYIVGNDPRSMLYINHKRKACAEVGIESKLTIIDGEEADWPLFQGIDSDNKNDKVHGILVQLPLPNWYDKMEVFDYINQNKDVDTFHPTNIGRLVQNRPRFKPCTPQAVIEILRRSGIKTDGKRIVVINRSLVVGLPLSTMLLQDDEWANATVTVCHDHTHPEMLKDITLSSDIIITAVGKRPNFVLTGDMVSKGAVVIDVAICPLENGKIVGDCDESVKNVAGYVSKVPGGVGPMTICSLLQNVFLAAELSFSTCSWI